MNYLFVQMGFIHFCQRLAYKNNSGGINSAGEAAPGIPSSRRRALRAAWHEQGDGAECLWCPQVELRSLAPTTCIKDSAKPLSREAVGAPAELAGSLSRKRPLPPLLTARASAAKAGAPPLCSRSCVPGIPADTIHRTFPALLGLKETWKQGFSSASYLAFLNLLFRNRKKLSFLEFSVLSIVHV